MKTMNIGLVSALLLALASCSQAQEPSSEQGAPAGDWATTLRHAQPKELAPDAQVEDWPGFLGPRRDGISRETQLLDTWGPEGPRLLWERACGTGFASPAIAQGHLVLTHRVGDRERIECLRAETGERVWSAEFPCEFRGEFISDHGPRATPFIDGERVFVHGIDGDMRCFELRTGKLLWEADWSAEYELPETFFGVVSSPLVYGDLLIQNLGEPKSGSVAAFDKESGELVWRTAPSDAAHSEWGASCASPVIAEHAGKTRLFVLTGGKSRPPQGGLMVLDPLSGELEASLPFRSRTYYSVNGTSPLVVGERVLLSSSYGVGSLCLELAEPELPRGKTRLKTAWKDRRLGLQFGNALHLDGKLFLANGAPGGVGSVKVLRLADGETLGELFLEVTSRVKQGDREQELDSSSGEASLLFADGKLFCLGDDGALFMLDVSGPEPRLMAAAALFHARWAWTPPVISKGLLYVRQTSPDGYTGKGTRLLCYDLRAQP